jgi:hypothetical protein
MLNLSASPFNPHELDGALDEEGFATSVVDGGFGKRSISASIFESKIGSENGFISNDVNNGTFDESLRVR